MYCPKCGTENPNDAQFCGTCSTPLPPSPPKFVEPIISKTSGLAIAAFVLGLLSFIFGIFTGIPAIILGIIALVKIEKSGGRITGKGFAIAGIVTPVFSFVLMIVILMPALTRVRSTAFRMVCGTNLSGLGKAMMIYSNDYDDEYPRAGGRKSQWAMTIPNWQANNRFDAFDINSDGTGGEASISSCFYLLVKYVEVTPKSFICKGDSGVTEFKPSDYGVGDRDPIELWDFGGDGSDGLPRAETHVSYSYHHPFSLYALTSSSDPGSAVAADRNPWITNAAAKRRETWDDFNPNGSIKQKRAGNSNSHKAEGQNVLFMDGHVDFITYSDCGIEDDNIYTYWDEAIRNIQKGKMPVPGDENTIPKDRTDSLLVHDGTP